MKTILFCDDDDLFLMSMSMALGKKYNVLTASDTKSGRIIVKQKQVDLLVLDVQMDSAREGLEAIGMFLEIEPDLPIVMCSGLTDFQVVRDAMKNGAVDYFAKGTPIEDLFVAVSRALDAGAHRIQAKRQSREIREHIQGTSLVGESPAIQNLKATIAKIKERPFNVLITGEKGTGKEVVARLLRRESSSGFLEPFQAVDSGTIQSSTAESLLFGHEKGAFTGADKLQKGFFEEADGGVIYFDEIGNMPIEIQNKLLRVIQEKEVRRLGSAKTISVNFRVVAATNQNLTEMCHKGLFKEDLYDRLNVLPINLPPLRERKEDIPLLINHFLVKHGALPGQKLSEAAVQVLMDYSWPGNIRELSNVIAYLVTMCSDAEIDSNFLPEKILTDSLEVGAQGDNLYSKKTDFEKEMLQKCFDRNGGNVAKMVAELKISRSHLYEKLKKYGIKSA